MLHIGICDDNPIILQKYQEIIQKIAKDEELRVSLHVFHSGEELLFELSEEINMLDFLYLDILMGKKNGIETAKELRALGCSFDIIYLTSSEEYVFASFDTMPLHYILKDSMDVDKFKEIFLKAVHMQKQKREDVFVYESGTIVKKIRTDEIFYFEVINRIITVYYKDKTFDFYSSMESVEEKVKGKGFVRVHRGYLVNMKYIDEILHNSVILSSGKEIPVGTTYSKQMKKLFSDYLVEAM